MEKLIVIEGKEKYQYKDLKSFNELEKKAVANTVQDNIKIFKF